jgi:hypothetical protein
VRFRRAAACRGSRRSGISPFRPTVRPEAVTPELLRERVLALCARASARFAVVDGGIRPVSIIVRVTGAPSIEGELS